MKLVSFSFKNDVYAVYVVPIKSITNQIEGCNRYI